MKVKDLSGKEHVLDVRQAKYPLRSEASCKSKIQYVCGQFLKSKYPMDPLLEEVQVPGENLALDFLIPTRRLAFEIHGRQHDEYVPHFHKSEKQFFESKKRDKRKEAWCDLNHIDLYTVRSLDELKDLF